MAKPAEQFHVAVGDEVTFSKTVAESDVYLFAGITGDFSGNHVNEEYMRHSRYKHRIAHGALLVGFMSTASTMMIDACVRRGITETPVSLGYDGVRFVAPVFINDTVTVVYRIQDVDFQKRRTRSAITVTNQKGTTVAVAEHILKWVSNG